MKITYSAAVNTDAGWRQVSVTAIAEKVSPGMAKVLSVELINGEKPAYGMSRTGAKRQEFNGIWLAKCQVGARKRISACQVEP